MIATTVLAAAAGAALAATSVPVEVSPKSIRTASATCGRGATAVSSGFEAPDFSAGNDSGVARIGVKQGRRGVKVRAYNFGEDRGRLIAHVYCLKGARAPVRSFERTTVAPGKGEVGRRGMSPRLRQSPGVLHRGLRPEDRPARLDLELEARTGRAAGGCRPSTCRRTTPTYTDPLRRPGSWSPTPTAREAGSPLTTVAKRVNVPAQPSGGEGSPTRKFRVSCPRGSRALSGGFDGNLTFRQRGERGREPSPRCARATGGDGAPLPSASRTGPRRR